MAIRRILAFGDSLSNLSRKRGIDETIAIGLLGLYADGDCTNEARGTIMIGPGSPKIFRDAALIAQKYGGQALDWVKKTSSTFTAADGTTFQTHWVENIENGLQVLFKTKIIP